MKSKNEEQINAEDMINKLGLNKRNSFLARVIGFFDLSFLGFCIIYSSFIIIGETDIWSWQMWTQIAGVTAGGSMLIQHGKNCR